MKAKIKLLIVDDMIDIREYFQTVLSNEPDIEVVGVASSGIEAFEKVKETNPDVILMDIQMESRTAGIDATSAIKKYNPNIKIIILTIHNDDEYLFQAYCAGVMDYIVKTDSISQILNSIRTAYSNELILRPGIADKIMNEFIRLKTQQHSMLYTLNIVSMLTNSEFEILKHVYNGHTYKAIAEARFVTQSTIKSQVTSILKKFEMKNMKEVVKSLKETSFYEIIKDEPE